MSQNYNHLDRQRSRLLWLVGILMAALCATLVLLSSAESAAGFSVERQLPQLVGLSGLVLIFVLYVHHKHRQFAAMESKLREMAVREATLQARFSELSFLFDTSTQLQLRLDLQGMLDLAVQRLVPCLDAHGCSIMLQNAETGMLEVKAATGVDASLVLGNQVAPGEGIAGQVFQSGIALNLSQDLMRMQFPEYMKHGRQIVGGLCVPLRFRGKAIGVVNVTRTTGEPFGETHQKMLEAFGDHCAATVVKTHHHHELLKQVRRVA